MRPLPQNTLTHVRTHEVAHARAQTNSLALATATRAHLFSGARSRTPTCMHRTSCFIGRGLDAEARGPQAPPSAMMAAA